MTKVSMAFAALVLAALLAAPPTAAVQLVVSQDSPGPYNPNDPPDAAVVRLLQSK